MLERVNETTKKTARVFDSQKLNKKDLFVVSLIRPGKYVATDDRNRNVTLDMPYPDITILTERDTVLNPITLRQTPDGFEKKDVRLLPSRR